jgi:ribosomal protein S18 acetylase RimI-like enzyme
MPGDADPAIAVVGLAFAADAATRWCFPDPHQFWTAWPAFARAFAGAAFAHGTAQLVVDPAGGTIAGAALWLPPGAHADEEALGALLEQTVPAAAQPELFAVLEQMGAAHPSEPHWYLPLIGVDPRWQGRGYGSALLAPALARCDQSQTLAYLEATSPRNKALYERHGFTVATTIQAGSSPTIWPMVRTPRPNQD